MPTGAFYGAKKACEPRQLIYNYADDNIYLVSDPSAAVGWAVPTDSAALVGTAHPTSLTADIRVYDIEARLLLAAHLPVETHAEPSRRNFKLPRLEHVTTTYFLSLRLLQQGGAEVANNFYWLSTTPDVLDYEAKVTPWEYYTPSKQYADLTLLNSLPPAEVKADCRIETAGAQDVAVVTLENLSDKIAFFAELLLVKDDMAEPVVPVFWQDNFVSLLPKEKRILSAAFSPTGPSPALTVRGWNINPFVVCP
jgi:exo-1,4-beta-D-glucosaminidase